jgi:hypothetical protein
MTPKDWTMEDGCLWHAGHWHPVPQFVLDRIEQLETALRLIADAKDVRGCDEIARQALGLTAETKREPT